LLIVVAKGYTFFWFFPKDEPEKYPLIIWLNGGMILKKYLMKSIGPGCSSMFGLFVVNQ
jgi:carboxypeptidase C (cathepsin A)